MFASFNPNISAAVVSRVQGLLQPFHLTLVPPTQRAPSTPTTLTLSFGQTASSLPLPSAPKNGYVIYGNTTHFSCNGDSTQTTVFAVYQLLQVLGYRFYHPFQPVVPAALTTAPVKIIEQPTNVIRLHHYHSEHPLEMTEMLQGMGPFDADRLEEWQLYIQWIVANRMTNVEWVMLCANDYKDFCWSDQRQQRIKQLIDTAHDFSVGVFLDVAIAMTQQHAMHMIQSTSESMAQQTQDIKTAVKWIVGCGVDGIYRFCNHSSL